jgi:hypothetical protein
MGLVGFAAGLALGWGVMYTLGYHFSSDTSFESQPDSAQMYDVMRADELRPKQDHRTAPEPRPKREN